MTWTYYDEANIEQTHQAMVLSAPDTVEGGHSYRLIGLNMDVSSVFIGNTETDFYTYEKDPSDIMIDIIQFTVPESAEEGTFNYRIQLYDGSTVIGPEVTVVSANVQ